jgi:membrane protease YdiL (CAAX protease family)
MNPATVGPGMVGTASALPTPLESGSVARYSVGVGVVVLAILSQYFVPEAWPASRAVYGSLAGDVAIVYVLPIAVFSVLVGAGPIRTWRANLSRATVQGLGWYGLMGLVALVVTIGLVLLYEVADPGALKLLEKPNPALQAAAGNPWFFVGFSFVVGALEETIFRGWIFGFWTGRTDSWLLPAVLSSLLFAALHVYYSTTYGVAAPLIFPTLFLLGFAFAATYHTTGGNLVVPAVLHGAYDATAYLTLVSLSVGTELRYLLLLVGVVVGLVYYLSRTGATDSGPGPPPPA